MATNSKPPLSGSGSEAYWVRLGRCLSTDCYSAHFGGCCTRRAHSSLHGTATAPCRAATAHRPAATLHCAATLQHCTFLQHCNTTHSAAATLCCTLHRTYTATKRSHHTYINLRCNVVTYIYAGLICSAILCTSYCNVRYDCTTCTYVEKLAKLATFCTQDCVTVQHTFV